VYHYCRYVTVSCKMENEIPVVCLVYLERILVKAGLLLNNENWKRLTLIALCTASKIWDDDSLENAHFPKVMPDVQLRMIQQLEKSFLALLDYDLVVKGSDYAKYYFILRTLAAEIKQEGEQKKRKKPEWGEFPLKEPITVEKMQMLQKNSAKAEVLLKEMHESTPFDKTI